MIDNECFVYVIGTEALRGDDCYGAPVKVGITAALSARLSSLQTASPRRLKFLSVFRLPDRASAFAMESYFHEKHASARLSGEWFDLCPLEAVTFLCRWCRANLELLRSGEGFEELDLWEAINWSGLFEAEQRCAEERYLAAWKACANG